MTSSKSNKKSYNIKEKKMDKTDLNIMYRLWGD